MHRTNGDSKGTATSAQGANVNVYRDAVAGVHDATQLRHQEMNAIQEEIANVIEAEGTALQLENETVAQMTQLNGAINNKLKASRITNDSSASGAYVDEALDNMDAAIANLDSTDIDNLSNVTGDRVTDALNTLRTTTGIVNSSALIGTTLKDVLDSLQLSRMGFMTGCGWGRHSVYEDNVGFNDGYAVDSTGTYLMRMPRMAGTTYFKKLANGVGYQAGYDTCGVPANITLAATNRLYIFLIRRQNGSVDIGYDTSLTAANLISDATCQATHYRRIGYLQVRTLNGGAVYVYQAAQRDDYHEISGGMEYSAIAEDWGGYKVADTQYLPNIDVIPIYQVAPPSGGDSKCIVVPRHYASTNYTNWLTNNGLWHGTRAGTVLQGSMSVVLPAYMSQTENGFYYKADPYTDITIRWRLLGFFDYRGKNIV